MAQDTKDAKDSAVHEDIVYAEQQNGEPGNIFSLCRDYGTYWWNVPHLRKTNIALLVPLLGSYVSGFDGSMMNGLQSVPAWNEGNMGQVLGLYTT
jgi:hypothetical protein